MKFGGESVEGVACRAQYHAIDERAQDLGGLGADAGVAERCFQIRHLAPVYLAEIGMEVERGGLGELRELRLDLALAVLEQPHACLERRGVHPVLGRLHDAGGLALGCPYRLCHPEVLLVKAA